LVGYQHQSSANINNDSSHKDKDGNDDVLVSA